MLELNNFIVKENSEKYHPKNFFKKKNIKLIKINYEELYKKFVKDFDGMSYYENILDFASIEGPNAFRI